MQEFNQIIFEKESTEIYTNCAAEGQVMKNNFSIGE